MMNISNAKKLKLIVRKLLETNEYKVRDHDLNLSFLVFKEYDQDIREKTVAEMFTLMNKKKIPTIDSILRCRRRLQQLYPELRGERYTDRMINKQIEKKEELGYAVHNNRKAI